MKFQLLAAGVLVLAALPFGARAEPAASTPRAPVVVELYTSQGCDQCPRANRLIGEWARDPHLIALTVPVGYWDYLGWRDTFARPEFADRQRDFTHQLRARAPFTPQLVIDGMRQISAADWDDARGALMEVQSAPLAPGAPTLSIERVPGSLRVSVSSGRVPDPADIWLMAYDPGPVSVTIPYGENRGRIVVHYNLVQRIWNIGVWEGAATTFNAAHCTPQCAVIVQLQHGGRILAAAMTRRHDPVAAAPAH